MIGSIEDLGTISSGRYLNLALDVLNWKMKEIFVSHKQVISVFDMKSMYFYETVFPTSNVLKILIEYDIPHFFLLWRYIL